MGRRSYGPCVRVCVHSCVRAWVRVHVCVCVVCARAHACVRMQVRVLSVGMGEGLASVNIQNVRIFSLYERVERSVK